MHRLALLAFTVLGAGCYPTSNICGSHPETVTGPDGGLVPCTRGEDCPLPDSMIVCESDSPLQWDCMRCEDTHCVLHVAELCR